MGKGAEGLKKNELSTDGEVSSHTRAKGKGVVV